MDDIKLSLDELFTTYKQYKNDTESIAGWLVQTALKCGHKVSPPGVPAAAPKSARLKGKARKQARDAAKGPQTDVKNTPKYLIHVSDFTAMATTIAQFKPKVDVPTALDNLFDRAIGARRITTAWHERHGHGDTASDQRHAHFTDVLTRTWELLRPFHATHKKKGPHDATRPSHARDNELLALSNRFSQLEVHDSAEQSAAGPGEEDVAPDNLKETSYRLPGGLLPVRIVQDEEEIEEEFEFAVALFLQELESVREHLKNVWFEYSQGHADLILASLLSNTAVHLVRKAEQQLDSIITRPKKYPASQFPVWSFPGILMHKYHHAQPSQIPAGSVEDVSKANLNSKSPRAMWRAECAHSTLCMWDVANGLDMTLNSCPHFTRRDTRRKVGMKVESLIPEDDDPELEARTKELMIALVPVSVELDKAFALDEVTRGVRYMIETRTLPIWVVFAVQMLLDAQDQLVDAPDKAVLEVQRHTRKKLADFEKLSFHTVTNNDHMKHARSVLQDHKRETLDGFWDRFMANALIMPPGVPRPRLPQSILKKDACLQMNPVRCGMLKYDLYLQLKNDALLLEWSWWGMSQMAHVYMACRQVFPEDSVWPDMEYMLQHQDTEHLFVGGVPTSLDESWRKFRLAMGVKPSFFAKMKNGRTSASSKETMHVNMARLFENPNVLDEKFVGYMIGGSRNNDTHIETWFQGVMGVIHDPKSTKKMTRRLKLSPVAEADLAREVSRRAKGSSIEDKLDLLEYFLTYAAFDQYFDWFAMQETCGRLWERMAPFVHDDEPAPPATRNRISTAYKILLEARDVEDVAVNLKVDDVPAFIRDHAVGLVEARRIIQTKLGAHVFDELLLGHRVPGTGDREMLSFGGDQELMKLCERTFEDSPYPSAQVSSYWTKLYRNWPIEILYKSAVLFRSGLGAMKAAGGRPCRQCWAGIHREALTTTSEDHSL